jgi:hypothetical protein
MAIKSKPKVVAVDKTDDVQAIGSIEQMYNKFVRNIDTDIVYKEILDKL